MSKSIVLHIGLPKTGTTYLQGQLAVWRERLLDRGILVPISCANPLSYDQEEAVLEHNTLAWALQRERDIRGLSREFILGSWDRLAEDFSTSRFEKCLLTSELMSWELDRAAIETLKSKLPSADVKVVFVGRDKADFLESIYLQAVKDWGVSGSVFDYLSNNFDVLSFEKRLLDWKHVFGDKNVVRVEYESFLPAHYFASFMEAAVGLTDLNDETIATTAKNPTIPADFLQTFLLLNRRGLRDVVVALQHEVVNIEGKPPRVLSQAERQLVRRILSN